MSLIKKAPKKRIRTTKSADERFTGPEPDWTGSENWTGKKYYQEVMRAASYYNYFNSGRDFKQELHKWMKNNDYSAADISAVKRLPDSLYAITVTGLAKNLNEGMPPTHPKEQEHIDSKPGLQGTATDKSEFLRERVAKMIEKGMLLKEPEKEAAKTAKPKPNIQDRIRDIAGEKTEELDAMIDAFLISPRKAPLKTHNVSDYFKKKEVNVAHARVIRKWYKKELEDLALVFAPKTKVTTAEDKEAQQDLLEAYGFLAKTQIKELYQFYCSIDEACDITEAEQKLNRKPKKKKQRTAADLTKGIKYKASDSTFGIASVDPTKLIGATMAVVFNTRLRKFGIYIAEDSRGFSAKGASITQFNTESSLQRTVRKPEDLIPNLKKTTKTRAVKLFEALTTTETKMNGRMNEHTVIMHVFR